MEIIGNYTLNLMFGEDVLDVTPQMIEEISVTQDIDRILPTFKVSLRDATKLLAERIPYDKNINKIRLELLRGVDAAETNMFNLAVKRRQVTSPADVSSVEGVLDIDEVVTEVRSNYFTGNIKTNITSIAKNLGINTVEIGSSLSYEKSFLQPNWTDAKLLRYLKRELLGKGGEVGYHCFIKVVRGEPILVFKSLDELLVGTPKFNFIIGPKEYEDFYPVSEYRIYDNSQLIADFGAKNQSYDYFNYTTGEYVETSVDVDDNPTLSEFLLMDEDRSNSSFLYCDTGRSNDFSPNFEGRVRNDFSLRSNNFIHMWISTWGLQNAAPGDIVKIMFGESFNRGDLFVYQHSGLWMVKRVVHMVGNTFLTNLLLTRAGIDTDIANTLKLSTKRQQR